MILVTLIVLLRRSIKSTLYQQRSSVMPALPKDLKEFKLPSIFANTNQGERFHILEVDLGEDKVIGFASSKCLNILFDSNDIFIDGTFDVAPKPFKQVVTVHAMHSENAIACAYFLTTSKREIVYTTIFQKLKSLAIECNKHFEPTFIHSDFENAILASIKKVFRNTRNVGCYFHFLQALTKKINKFGWKAKISADQSLRRFKTIMKGIPLLPKQKINVIVVYGGKNTLLSVKFVIKSFESLIARAYQKKYLHKNLYIKLTHLNDSYI